MTPQKNWNKSNPPHHFPWAWIISENLKQKRPTTLIRIQHYKSWPLQSDLFVQFFVWGGLNRFDAACPCPARTLVANSNRRKPKKNFQESASFSVKRLRVRISLHHGARRRRSLEQSWWLACEVSTWDIIMGLVFPHVLRHVATFSSQCVRISSWHPIS